MRPFETKAFNRRYRHLHYNTKNSSYRTEHDFRYSQKLYFHFEQPHGTSRFIGTKFLPMKFTWGFKLYIPITVPVIAGNRYVTWTTKTRGKKFVSKKITCRDVAGKVVRSKEGMAAQEDYPVTETERVGKKYKKNTLCKQKHIKVSVGGKSFPDSGQGKICLPLYALLPLEGSSPHYYSANSRNAPTCFKWTIYQKFLGNLSAKITI